MSPAEFRNIIEGLHLTQMEASRVFGVSGRAIRAWIAGDRAIPEPLAKLLRLLASGAVSVDQVRDA